MADMWPWKKKPEYEVPPGKVLAISGPNNKKWPLEPFDRSTLTIQPLSAEQMQQLRSIQPSIDLNNKYYPCLVKTRDGVVHERVIVKSVEVMIASLINFNEDMIGSEALRIENLAYLEESPQRLPVHFANMLYMEGESAMGCKRFQVIFDDGSKQTYQVANYVDFLTYPNGKGPNDVKNVIPHDRITREYLRNADYRSCYFSGPDPE